MALRRFNLITLFDFTNTLGHRPTLLNMSISSLFYLFKLLLQMSLMKTLKRINHRFINHQQSMIRLIVSLELSWSVLANIVPASLDKNLRNVWYKTLPGASGVMARNAKVVNFNEHLHHPFLKSYTILFGYI